MKKIIFFLTLIASIFIISTLVQSIFTLWRKQVLVETAQTKLERAQKENQKLKQEFSRVQSPSFVEQEARDKLLLIKPNEEEIILPSGMLEASASGKEKHTVSKTSWQAWWELFF